MSSSLRAPVLRPRKSFGQRLRLDLSRHWALYLLVAPAVAVIAVFSYAPMYGVVIAFKNFRPAFGILDSPWVGLRNFERFFSSYQFTNILTNTLGISLYSIAACFPAPVILALMMNQVRNKGRQRAIQTITYMPHFISIVVVCGLLAEFCESDGLINDVLAMLGMERTSLLANPRYFRTVFVASDIWQNVGWGTIIYLATLTGVDPSLHEAAAIDGAGRLQRIWHVNLPALMPVIVVQLIMRVGRMMLVGFDKVILLYSPATYETADVISSYVYRRGLSEMDYSYGAAVGLFNSVVNLIILVSANAFSRRVTGNSLW